MTIKCDICGSSVYVGLVDTEYDTGEPGEEYKCESRGVRATFYLEHNGDSGEMVGAISISYGDDR